VHVSPALEPLIQCARPVIFRTDAPDFPFSVAGTSFLVGFGRHAYVATAGHVLGLLPYSKLLIFPTHGHSTPLRLTDGWRCQDNENHPDASDLYLASFRPSGLPVKARRGGRLIPLRSIDGVRWHEDRWQSFFFTFGYPKTDTYADYERQQVRHRPYVLYGTYAGPGSVPGCHRLRIKNPLGLPSLDGLSGSPVFSIPSAVAVGEVPRFCGMLLRGTASSGIVHFLDSRVIVQALEQAGRAA
jgi:hypothetical protein